MKLKMTISLNESVKEENESVTNLYPEAIFWDGKRNLILRLADEQGNIRKIYSWKRMLADVKYFEHPDPEKRQRYQGKRYGEG